MKTTESHVCGVEKMFLSSGDGENLENSEQLLSSNLNFQIFGTGVAFASVASLASSLKNWMQSVGCYLMLNLKRNPNENVEVDLAVDTKLDRRLLFVAQSLDGCRLLQQR